MNLIYSFYIPQTEQLINLCKVSNNLYNQALYLFRQALKNENKWLWYADMDKLMKATPNLEGGHKLQISESSGIAANTESPG